jgi:hypothetical protein
VAALVPPFGRPWGPPIRRRRCTSATSFSLHDLLQRGRFRRWLSGSLGIDVGDIGIGAAIAQRLVKRIGVRTTGAIGMLIAAFSLLPTVPGRNARPASSRE